MKPGAVFIDLKPGDVFFVMNHGNWLSEAIAWFMGSKWSHAGLIYEVTNREIYTIETTNFQTSSQYFLDYIDSPSSSYEVWSPVDVSDGMRLLMCAQAKTTNEMTYGYLQLLSLGVRRLLMRCGIKVGNFFRQGQVCCHVVTKAYHGVLDHPAGIVDPESIDTEELYALVKAHGFIKVAEKESTHGTVSTT